MLRKYIKATVRCNKKVLTISLSKWKIQSNFSLETDVWRTIQTLQRFVWRDKTGGDVSIARKATPAILPLVLNIKFHEVSNICSWIIALVRCFPGGGKKLQGRTQEGETIPRFLASDFFFWYQFLPAELRQNYGSNWR